eukprot:478601-Prorocentrum_minimum.AAC.2
MLYTLYDTLEEADTYGIYKVLELTPRVLEFTPCVLEFTPHVLKFTQHMLKLTPDVIELTPGADYWGRLHVRLRHPLQ